MSVKLFKITTAVLASATLSSSTLPLVNISANTNTEIVKSADGQEQSNYDAIQVLDKYVTVVNNQFVLSVPNNANISNELIAKAQEAINKSNESITQNHLVINATKKTITANPIFSSKAAWHSYYTSASFWWGTRFYFTSNAAVDQYTTELDKLSIGAGATAAATISLGVVPGIIASLGAGYAQVQKADLIHYNKVHASNQIYMDVNNAGVYDMHVLA